MALRPFSLLLLLVMIPAITMLDKERFAVDVECWRKGWFCFHLHEHEEKNKVIRPKVMESDEFQYGGIAIDTSIPHEWKIIFDHGFDTYISYKDSEKHHCGTTIITKLVKRRISCLAVIDSYSIPDIEGIHVVPYRYSTYDHVIEYKLVVPPGQYVSDFLELYINPSMNLGVDKWLQKYAAIAFDPEVTDATTTSFQPFQCEMYKRDESPQDATAKTASQTDNTFTCDDAEQTIFLGGASTGLAKLYCSQGGWKNEQKKDILIQPPSEKSFPYCFKDTIFKDCAKNRCFVFGNALKAPKPDDVIEKVDNPDKIKEKLGAYVEYSKDDKTWILQIDYLHMTLVSFAIGDEKYEINHNHKFNSIISGNKVTATIIRAGPRLLSGKISKRFTLEANKDQTTKELTELFGFYGNAENALKLVFETKNYVAKLVANHKKYEPVGSFPFPGGFPINKPHDETNMFTCTGDRTIYLNTERTKVKQLRFTAKGWLFPEGKLAYKIVKDGKEDIAFVNCFSVCEATGVIPPPTGPKPTKRVTEKSVDYTCNKAYVKVNGKSDQSYTILSCENDQWLGDGQKFDIENNKFKIECHGENKFVRDCSDPEIDAGCTAVGSKNGAFSCDPGFALGLEGNTDYKGRVFTSLSWNRLDDNWSEGAKILRKAIDTDRVVCYSKCRKGNVDGEVTGTGNLKLSVEYKYNPSTKIGTLKCTDENVLLSELEGSEKNYVNGLICDKDGWKDGATVKKDFNTPVTDVKQLKVTAYCFKACDSSKIKKGCDTITDRNKGCAAATYTSAFTLECHPTHILFANDVAQQRALVCTRRGWTLAGDDTLVIDFNTKLRDPITAMCLSKCGTHYIKGSADTSSKNIISCSGTQMINYKVNGGEAENTLENLKCEENGWKAGSLLIADFAAGTQTIEATCKPSCDQSLISSNCIDRSGCKGVKYASDVMSCEDGLYLYSDLKLDSKMHCTKKAFETMEPSSPKKISIARVDPTTKAEISCISKCDKYFVDVIPTSGAKAINDAGKFTYENKGGKDEISCNNELYYTTILVEGDPTEKTFATKKFTCDLVKGWTGQDSALARTAGKRLTAGCRYKCKDRIKPLLPIVCPPTRDCKMPKNDDYKLKCEDPTHVLILLGDSGKLDKEFGTDELQCKKDGFYHNDKRVLEFKAKAEDDVAYQFDAFCVTRCDKELVLKLSETIKNKLQELHKINDKNPAIPFSTVEERNSPADPLKCKEPDTVLLVNYGGKAREEVMFGGATCDTATGWKGATSQYFFKFADFPGQFKISADCVNVCKDTMIYDECEVAKTNICSKKGYDSNTKALSCDSNYRLFLNDKKSAETATTVNTMTCSNEGWEVTGGSEMIVDFTAANVDVTTMVRAQCKHKCNDYFVDRSTESFPEACTKGTTCTQATYKDAKLSCGDPSASDSTVILVIEHNGVRREAWESAECSDAGWKDTKGNVLFKLDGFNYHVKARCEQLCSPNVDVVNAAGALETHNYDPVKKTLTCVDVNQMLALDNIGMYSDMTCSMEGWKNANSELKVNFNPIIDQATENSEKTERVKKFTCILNDCIRPKYCNTTNTACTDPDIETVKYAMSCTSPNRLIKFTTGQTGSSPIYYSDVICEDGKWVQKANRNDPTPVVPPLTDATIAIAERPEFPVVCSSATCTLCKNTLYNITSGTDTNIIIPSFVTGDYVSCSRYECPNSHFVIQGKDQKKKYYYNDPASRSAIKCAAKDTSTAHDFHAPDGASSVAGAIGCVKQIPCNEHSRIDTTCKDGKCDEAEFDALLDVGSKSANGQVPPVTCGVLGQMYHETVENDKKVWKVVKELQCDEKGEWKASIFMGKPDGPTTETKLKHTKDSDPAWRVICSIYDPNPEAEKPAFDAKTQTCLACADAANKLKCDDCKSYAASKNDGKGGCVMNIPSGYRFKIDGKKEVSGHLKCQMTNGVYEWKTAEGLKVNTLAVVSHAISTGAIVGIAFGVILVLGMIVFAMVFVAIRRKREQERLEKLKSKGLEQKQDTIIDNVTLVEDSKTLVL